MILKLGHKARFFYDPISKVKVLPGRTVEVSKLSSTIRRAIQGGALIIVEGGSSETSVKESLVVLGLSSTQERKNLHPYKKLGQLTTSDLDKFYSDLFIYAEDVNKFNLAKKTVKINAIEQVLEFHDKCQELLATKKEQLTSPQTPLTFVQASCPFKMDEDDKGKVAKFKKVTEVIEFYVKQFPIYVDLF
jgi:hypothetical protein